MSAATSRLDDQQVGELTRPEGANSSSWWTILAPLSVAALMVSRMSRRRLVDEVVHLVDGDVAVRGDEAEGVGADGEGDAQLMARRRLA